MAKASSTVEVAASAEDVWRVIADFGRYPEWLVIHKQWVDKPPTEPTVGASFKQDVVILGPSATVSWTVRAVEAGRRLEVAGPASTGVDLRIAFVVRGGAEESSVTLELDITGGPLDGPLGDMVEKVVTAELDRSLDKLRALVF